MDKNQSAQQQCKGILLVAFALISQVISQVGPEDFPADIPERPEEELPENEPFDEPEIDQDDLVQEEEIDLEGQEEVPELAISTHHSCRFAIMFLAIFTAFTLHTAIQHKAHACFIINFKFSYIFPNSRHNSS